MGVVNPTLTAQVMQPLVKSPFILFSSRTEKSILRLASHIKYIVDDVWRAWMKVTTEQKVRVMVQVQNVFVPTDNDRRKVEYK